MNWVWSVFVMEPRLLRIDPRGSNVGLLIFTKDVVLQMLMTFRVPTSYDPFFPNVPS